MTRGRYLNNHATIMCVEVRFKFNSSSANKLHYGIILYILKTYAFLFHLQYLTYGSISFCTSVIFISTNIKQKRTTFVRDTHLDINGDYISLMDKKLTKKGA